jgi:hypothetical protein
MRFNSLLKNCSVAKIEALERNRGARTEAIREYLRVLATKSPFKRTDFSKV